MISEVKMEEWWLYAQRLSAKSSGSPRVLVSRVV